MEIASSLPSGTWNFDVTPRFFKLCSPMGVFENRVFREICGSKSDEITAD